MNSIELLRSLEVIRLNKCQKFLSDKNRKNFIDRYNKVVVLKTKYLTEDENRFKVMYNLTRRRSVLDTVYEVCKLLEVYNES